MPRRGERLTVDWPAAAGAGEAAVCVAFSGGLDSTFLLHALHEAARGRPLTAVHVHHGLSPNADRWAEACAKTCAALGVPLDVVRVHVDRASGAGVEAEARRQRYEVYARRPEPFVALAHHRDDQAETVLLQLLRGTGMKGIAAMPRIRALNERVSLYRPLLDVDRARIESHARERGWSWVDDESNASLAHDRNFLRHEALPALDGRFPAWRDAAARFARHAATAQALLEALAAVDGVPDAAGKAMALDRALSQDRRANALRAFLALNGLAPPSEARLAEMARQLFEARADATVRLDHEGVLLTRHRGRARIEAPAPGPWRVDWQGEPRVALGEALGEVRFQRSRGSGLCASRAGGRDWFFAPRSGGERLRLAPGRPSRTLKNLLQEHDLSVLDRARLPLLFHGEALVWAPGIGIAAEYACAPGEPGLRPSWRVAGKAPLC